MKKLGLITLSISALFLAACSGNSEASGEDALVNNEKLEIVHGPWDTEVASTHVIGAVLENVGYDVTLTQLDNGVMWQSIAAGEVDGQVGAWMPQTSAPFVEEYGDQVDYLGPNLHGAALGLVVPTYMENVNSIEDLTNQADQTITGIEAGASVVAGAESAAENYDNLSDWTVETSSTGAMTAALSEAISNEEEIVVTGWSPHWKFQEYDLKYLEDPQGAFGDEEFISTITRQNLEGDHPTAHSILDNFYWEVEDMEQVMLDIQGGAEPEQAAEDFVENNQDLVSEWTAEAEEMASSESSSE